MFVRWTQFGTFQPLDRLHSNHGDRLPWEYPGEPERITTAFLQLRGRLVPHLYTLAREAHDTGLPMARALFLQWPELDDAYAFPMQFTLGDDLLVATVAVPGDPATVDVWIPPGTWVNYFTGERHEGPARIEATVPLDRYPVYARAGSILPTQPDLPTSSAGPQDDLVLTVWTGGDGTYRLYEDDGDGFGYEDGEYAWTEVVSRADGRCVEVEIEAVDSGDFPDALQARAWSIRVIGADDSANVRIDGAAVDASQMTVSGDTVTVQTGQRATDATTLVEVGCE
jgi:alpha-glucosidase (family GH31 glycosyl hydrolase)